MILFTMKMGIFVLHQKANVCCNCVTLCITCHISGCLTFWTLPLPLLKRSCYMQRVHSYRCPITNSQTVSLRGIVPISKLFKMFMKLRAIYVKIFIKLRNFNSYTVHGHGLIIQKACEARASPLKFKKASKMTKKLKFLILILYFLHWLLKFFRGEKFA